MEYLSGYLDPIVVVTILLFLVTAFLYREAAKSGSLAKASADAANRAVDISEKNLKELKQQFEESNRPRIAIVNFKVQTTISEYVSIFFHAYNVGKFPADVRSLSIKGSFEDRSNKEVTGLKNEILAQNEFLVFNSQAEINYKIPLPIELKTFFIKGGLTLNFQVSTKYFSSTFHKEYDSIVDFRISYLGELVNIAKNQVSEQVTSL